MNLSLIEAEVKLKVVIERVRVDESKMEGDARENRNLSGEDNETV